MKARSWMKVMGGALVGAALSLGCGVEAAGQERVGGVEAPGGRQGQVALVPLVEVDGLERLADRSNGNVFLEEVLLHGVAVRVRTLDGREHDVSGGERFYLRYNPAAGEAGLTRLWVPASQELDQLTVQVQPDQRSLEQLEAESRTRGMNLTELQGASVLIRGMVAVANGHGANSGGAGSDRNLQFRGLGCVNGSCGNTVPDTAPADGPFRQLSDDNGTVPDTAPAEDEVAKSASGLSDPNTPGSIPRREFRKFTVVASARFLLQARLDPGALAEGGTVHLHLDANALFSDESLESLQMCGDAANNQVLRRSLSGEDVVRASRFEVNEVAVTNDVKPR